MTTSAFGRRTVGSNVPLGLGKLLFLGGDVDGTGHVDEIMEYDAGTETWIGRQETLPSAVKSQSAVLVKNGLITC